MCRHIHVTVKVDYIFLVSLGLIRLFDKPVFINAYIMGCERQQEFGCIFLSIAIVQIKICLIYYTLKMQYFDFRNIIFLFEMI